MLKKLKTPFITLMLTAAVVAFFYYKSKKNEQCLYHESVGVITRTYTDASRNRPLVVEIWYPLNKGLVGKIDPESLWMEFPQLRDAQFLEKKLPLLMVSHGYRGNRFSLSWLSQFLASQGFIIAAVEHFGNTDSDFNLESSLRPWNRPLDITFVLTQLLRDPLLSSHINKDAIGFIGHSQGGLTGLWLAGARVSGEKLYNFYNSITDDIPPHFHQVVRSIDFTYADNSFYDNRIKSFLLMSPGLMKSEAVEVESLQPIATSFMIITPEGDEINPPEYNAYLFAYHLYNSRLIKLSPPANHFIFIRQQSPLGRQEYNDEELQDLPVLDRRKIHCSIAQQALDFFNETLLQQPAIKR